MQRVTRSTAVAVLPAPPAGAGSPGYFSGGNAGTGTPATVPGYEWFNGVQEELLAVIEGAGLTPSEVDNTLLLQAITQIATSVSTPAGAIVAFPAAAAPTGWLKCNGALLSRTTYGALWAYAQASGNLVSDTDWTATARPGSFSSGDGSTTFRIPDFRGLFLRGYHDGSGTYDSDTATALGRYRDSQNKTHTHKTDGTDGGNRYVVRKGSDGPVDYTSSDINSGDLEYQTDSIVGYQGGAESYPRHASSLICIKY